MIDHETKKSKKQIRDEEAFVKTFVKRYGNPKGLHPYSYSGIAYKKDVEDLSNIENIERFFNSCKDCKHRKGNINYSSSTICLATKKVKKLYDPLTGLKKETTYKSCRTARGGTYNNPNPICEMFEPKFSFGKVIMEALKSTKNHKPSNKEELTERKVEIDQIDTEAECLSDTDENNEQKPKTTWWQRIINPSYHREK